jgi:hypothetical protein
MGFPSRLVSNRDRPRWRNHDTCSSDYCRPPALPRRLRRFGSGHIGNCPRLARYGNFAAGLHLERACGLRHLPLLPLGGTGQERCRAIAVRVGTKAGDVPGYNFSPALKASVVTWDRQTLDTWLQGPMKMVPGTKMVIGVPNPEKRKEVIDYLESLK